MTTWCGSSPATSAARRSRPRTCDTSSSTSSLSRFPDSSGPAPAILDLARRSAARRTGPANAIRCAHPSSTTQVPSASGTACSAALTLRDDRSSRRRAGGAGWISMLKPPDFAEAVRTARSLVVHERGTARDTGRSRARSASSSIVSARSTNRLAEASMSCPNGVRLTPRPERSKSRAPNRFSSPAIRLLATGCGTPLAAAPSVILPNSLTAVNVRHASIRSIVTMICIFDMQMLETVFDHIT